MPASYVWFRRLPRRRSTPHTINVQGWKGRFRAAFLWVKERSKCLENCDKNSLKVKYFARGLSGVANLLTAQATWSSRSSSMQFPTNMNAMQKGQMPKVISIGGIIPPIKKSDDHKAEKRASQLAVSFILSVATLWSSEALLPPKFTRAEIRRHDM